MVSRNILYTQCSGDDSSPCNVAIITSADKTEPLPDMSFRGSEASRGIFPSGKFYLVLVLSPTWWIPPLRFAAVGMTKRGNVFRYYRKQFRPFERGTAHRPFPTVRLGLFTFAPAVSTMRNVALPVFRITAVVKYPNQRNRRERPVCRSGGVANTTRAGERNHPPTCHSEGANASR